MVIESVRCARRCAVWCGAANEMHTHNILIIHYHSFVNGIIYIHGIWILSISISFTYIYIDIIAYSTHATHGIGPYLNERAERSVEREKRETFEAKKINKWINGSINAGRTMTTDSLRFLADSHCDGNGWTADEHFHFPACVRRGHAR